ncbi:hypothetical protein ymoll0001_18200 [Yersinia mollaretii ATCC 43969]|uniref:Uncharacterized protein n=1 Tax=Yersinia mollaretii (strain ATCC 43969 / DSM 18520 / CIP 103324 / CNY 7263 / WAIP 204) TaxID=349967 RepID=A0ABP2EFK9_YERMW|nr:hypothetical protein ymoll0001_18200 [Yersinia mollaretii ATCC 43969]
MSAIDITIVRGEMPRRSQNYCLNQRRLWPKIVTFVMA